MQTLKKMLKNKKGSTLVGVVALSVVMGIGIAGLMGISRNTISQEIDAFDDTNALLAAESGLLAVSSWIRNSTTAMANSSTTINYTVPRIGGANIVVPVDVTVTGIGGNNWRFTSTARHPSFTQSHTKTVQWDVEIEDTPLPSGWPGTFTNTFDGIQNNGVREQIFDGPFHSNAAIPYEKQFKNQDVMPPTGSAATHPNMLAFSGPVTVYDSRMNFINYDPNNVSRQNTNYNKGLILGNSNGAGNETALNLDQKVFYSSFDPNADSLGTRITYDGAEHPITGGVLKFGVDANGPYYTVNGGNQVHYSVPIMISSTGNPLTIAGGSVIGGVVTVTTQKAATNAARDVKIDLASGNIIYYGVTIDRENPETNFGIGTSSSDILAVYSGRNIELAVNGSNTSTYITAQLFASDNKGSGSQVGTLRITGGNNGGVYYVIGNTVMDKWWNQTPGTNDPKILVLHDRRQVAAHGINFTSGNGNIVNSVRKFVKILGTYAENNNAI